MLVLVQRYVTSIVTGVVVTFILLWIMQLLIATGKQALTEKREFRFLDFVRVEREDVTELKKRKPDKPDEPDKPPPDMPQPQADDIDTGESVNIAPVSADVDVNIGGIGGFDMAEGEYLPIVKVAPIYPRRAQSRGLEGFCILEFTVTKLGTTEDIRTVECSSTLFERASVNAAAKFKYKPRVVNGEPIAVPGVQNKITFQLED